MIKKIDLKKILTTSLSHLTLTTTPFTPYPKQKL